MKVLVAADAPALRKKLQSFFRARGHRVTCRGAESLGGRDDHAFVLVDLALGEPALNLVRRCHDDGEPCAVLVLADDVSPERLRPALEAGADDFLLKPIDDRALRLRLAIAERNLALRRQHAAAKAAAEQRHRTLLETMDEGLFLVDAEGRIELTNSRFSELTGFTSDELIGQSADQLLVDPEVRQRLPEQTLLGSGTGSDRYAIPLRTKEDGQRWVSLSASPTTTADGRPASLGVVSDLTEQRNVEQALRHREAYFRVLWENLSDLVTVLDLDGRVLFQSNASETLLGLPPEDLVGRDFTDQIHDQDRDRFTEAFSRALAGREAASPISVRFRHQGGAWRHLESLCDNLIDNPVVGGIVVTSRDVTEAKLSEDALRRERAFFQQLFRNAPTGIVILDNDDCVVDANEPFEEMFQFGLGELRGRPLSDFIVPDELREEATALSQGVFRKQTVERETVRQRKNGTRVEVAILGYPIELADRRIGAYGIYSDITKRKQAERKLFHEAFHDALTSLPNRTLLTERLTRALARTRRGDYSFAVLFIDLDHFKAVNDRFGHAAGDELLIEMAARIESCLRPGDTTARLGGDELTVVLEDLVRAGDAPRIAERILARLAEPFILEGQEVIATGSIGIALSGGGYRTPDEILRDADIAMYRAKARGRNCYEIFDAEMHESAVARQRLEAELSKAVESGELVLAYQPIVSLATGRLVAFEALVRWRHPERGLLHPKEVLPVAEESGLIVPLGRWVVGETCAQLARWQEAYPDRDGVLVHINVSPYEMRGSGFLEHLENTVEASGAKPAAIGLEITERLLLESGERFEAVLWQLRKSGYRLSVDDFGTGFSSLSLLHRLPLDSLKVDRSFVRELTPGGDDLEIVRAITALADSLGMTVVAEGVETDEQIELLAKLGVGFAQGFLFSRPVAADKAAAMIEQQRTW